MDKELLKIIERKRQAAYIDSDSILKRYDQYLESNGIYHSSNYNIFRNAIKGRVELCDGILKLYSEAKYENERIVLLEDLWVIGYDADKLVELILLGFNSGTCPDNLWEYAQLLYSIKNYRYLSQYVAIIQNKSYGNNRQMLILLVGESKKESVIPVLTELLNDSTVYGHALDALTNFSGDEIDRIMSQYWNCSVDWIRKIAQRYLARKKNIPDGDKNASRTGDGSLS